MARSSGKGASKVRYKPPSLTKRRTTTTKFATKGRSMVKYRPPARPKSPAGTQSRRPTPRPKPKPRAQARPRPLPPPRPGQTRPPAPRPPEQPAQPRGQLPLWLANAQVVGGALANLAGRASQISLPRGSQPATWLRNAAAMGQIGRQVQQRAQQVQRALGFGDLRAVERQGYYLDPSVQRTRPAPPTPRSMPDTYLAQYRRGLPPPPPTPTVLPDTYFGQLRRAGYGAPNQSLTKIYNRPPIEESLEDFYPQLPPIGAPLPPIPGPGGGGGGGGGGGRGGRGGGGGGGGGGFTPFSDTAIRTVQAGRFNRPVFREQAPRWFMDMAKWRI